MEWIADPNAWIGLATLVVLEIVLGIDNLVFIAILAEKLPPEQRDRARLIGLSLALVMRLVLLASISWIVTLTSPLFSLGSFSFSGRDLILIVGGVFLLAKGTMELHERLEGHEAKTGGVRVEAVFWQVIAQIVILDAVFSLDSVITAVGMVEHLMVMVIAVIVAMAIMMLASKPLMAFVNRHPTVVILCLGFLLMIGFSLVTEGFGYHLPKGYLYAAIGFSVLIEAANQFRSRKTDSEFAGMDMRERTAAAVLKLLGGRRRGEARPEPSAHGAPDSEQVAVFAPAETDMIQGVLTLAERPVRTIMSPRAEIQWIDLGETQEEVRADILDLTHSTVLLCRDGLDGFVGVAATTDLLHSLAEGATVDLQAKMRQPVIVHEGTSVLRLMEQLRRSSTPISIVVDEYGSVVGVATPTDILEAIAGEFPDRDEAPADMHLTEDGSWTLDGFVDVHRASAALGVDLVDASHRYTTLNGYIVWKLGDIPRDGQRFRADGLEIEILAMKGRTVDKARLRLLAAEAVSEMAD
ncbi:TerC family protein [Aureimonas sp. AU40]|uniref:TerC family protein n=1 Tax=Aureimonas sp. AU40 TaxID=1637747 RepID=UPI00078206C7|nr:TerC family protein [Aureimonas sp. AU40]